MAKKEKLLNQFSAVPDDLILFAVGHHAEVNKTLDRLRIYVAHELGLIDNSRHSILWVNDFSMFEWNDSEQRLEVSLQQKMKGDELNNNNNPLPPHQVEEQFDEVAPRHDRVFRDYARPDHFEEESSVRRPPVAANNFEIRTGLVQII
ncbi:Aspartate--tRNA(Asp/Asn) ligase [Capsicum baccatum]|uniref:Aspartate--tRNA(Asp/Asn) ligase n=1 Tax=Capsicum baccatum TaxID=33114 RepID=A0A2G2XCP5_CAPBA|nr:Aspartate--tRNA(Asp/Asn) ligase [Capsicum baccatum]